MIYIDALVHWKRKETNRNFITRINNLTNIKTVVLESYLQFVSVQKIQLLKTLHLNKITQFSLNMYGISKQKTIN